MKFDRLRKYFKYFLKQLYLIIIIIIIIINYILSFCALMKKKIKKSQGTKCKRMNLGNKLEKDNIQ